MTKPARPVSSPDAEIRAESVPDRPVPLMDPTRIYPAWGPEAEVDVVEILRSHAYVKGRHVQGFEESFAQYIGVQHAVAVDSCTDALELVFRTVLEDRAPDRREVILPTFTFVATAGAVVNAGGVPVFADVDPDTWNLDPVAVEALVSERTAAVVPVHLFGNPADVRRLREVVGPDVFVLEDAAQAVHATVDGRRCGSLGGAGTFSFYPSKNLGAAGDGGIVTTDDDHVAAVVRALRDHGQTRKMYDHARVGTNSRMDEIQAAVLRRKLPHIADWTHQRQAIAARYDLAFQGSEVTAQQVPGDAVSAYHLYTVRVPDRDAVREALGAEGVHTGVYYPMPLHRQSCFSLYEARACPVADALSDSVLSLPCFPGLLADEQSRVIEAVRRIVG